MISLGHQNGTAATSRSSLSLSSYESRTSIDDSPENIIDNPPDYDPLLSIPMLRKKFNVEPREDEGNEILPAYSTAISLCNVFLHKKELEGAVHRAHDRTWYKVSVTLQGTALTLHKYRSGGMLAGWGREGADIAVSGKKGGFLKSYNLQHADVGIAADYYK